MHWPRDAVTQWLRKSRLSNRKCNMCGCDLITVICCKIAKNSEQGKHPKQSIAIIPHKKGLYKKSLYIRVVFYRPRIHYIFNTISTGPAKNFYQLFKSRWPAIRRGIICATAQSRRQRMAWSGWYWTRKNLGFWNWKGLTGSRSCNFCCDGAYKKVGEQILNSFYFQ